MQQKPRILFLFPHSAAQLVRDTRSGKQPSERLYGINELCATGWDITISDERFDWWGGRFITQLKNYNINLINFATLKQIRSHDVVMVKDDFSFAISLACFLFRKHLVYYDSMFQVPRRRLDRFFTRLSLLMCTRVLTYSDYQIDLWSAEFRIPRSKLRKIPYAMDSEYYLRDFPSTSDGGYVLSIGRDVGRDFRTLVAACKKVGVPLKLITLDYLTKDIGLPDPAVEVIQDVSYRRLFELYAAASVVALPLKKGITYPSGIRAALECLLIRKPLVVTETPVLREMLPSSSHTFFARPEDETHLSEQIGLALGLDHDELASASPVRVASLEDLRSSLEQVLLRLAE